MEPGGVAQRFLQRTQPSLEAQLCNLADEIAYNAHDIDDGVRSGLITLAQLQDVALFDDFRCQTLVDHPHLQDKTQGRRLLYEAIRRMLSSQVYDVIAATQNALDLARPTDVDAVRQSPPLVQFSAAMRDKSKALKAFLLQKLYRHPQVLHTTGQARQVVRDLFDAYVNAPQEMPESHQRRAGFPNLQTDVMSTDTKTVTVRAVADYIAGMTDRFAAREHQRLTGLQLLSQGNL
jgi:dGTPase